MPFPIPRVLATSYYVGTTEVRCDSPVADKSRPLLEPEPDVQAQQPPVVVQVNRLAIPAVQEVSTRRASPPISSSRLIEPTAEDKKVAYCGACVLLIIAIALAIASGAKTAADGDYSSTASNLAMAAGGLAFLACCSCLGGHMPRDPSDRSYDAMGV